MLPEGVLHTQLPPFLENHDSHRGELLRDRPDREARLWSVGNAILRVREPVAFGKEHVIVLGDDHGAAELVFLMKRSEVCVQAVAESLCDGSITPILTHMVRTGELSKNDREQIRALIDQPDQPTRQKPRRKNK